jgi:hypothetical protein
MNLKQWTLAAVALAVNSDVAAQSQGEPILDQSNATSNSPFSWR